MADDNLGRDDGARTDIVALVSDSTAEAATSAPSPPRNQLLFMKIKLKESEDMLLYENNSRCVTVDTSSRLEAEETGAIGSMEASERVTNLTPDEGQQERRAKSVETQTSEPLRKTRGINTDQICQTDVGCYVSNYDMFDTYVDLERFTESIDLADDNNSQSKIFVTTYLKDGVGGLNRLLSSEDGSFKLPSMVLQRILASNVFHRSQCRYRNMKEPSPLDLSIRYLYSVELLCKYHASETGDLSVSCMSWCSTNSDVLAVGYGVYRFAANEPGLRGGGCVCIWSIKVRAFDLCEIEKINFPFEFQNPMSPERSYRFARPVVSLAFCDGEYAQLLAVGFADGSLRIVDVSCERIQSHVATSERATSPPAEPVWGIKWLKGISQSTHSTVVPITC